MRIGHRLLLLVVCGSLSTARAALPPEAEGVLARVHARGKVRCGGVERPGLAHAGAKGRFAGLEIDVCRAVAAAVLGSADRIEYHAYDASRDFDAVRDGTDDLYFLTGSEVNREKLAGKVLPVATVFVESQSVMVPVDSPARHLRDLAGKSICFLIGSPVERGLENAFETLGVRWFPVPFSEEGEMNDAYEVQRCHAIAGERTTLATIPLHSGVNQLSSRILPEPLVSFPIMAATGTADARWSAVVAWTVHTVVSGERPETKWYSGGAWAMPIEASELGLAKGWQSRVLGAVGDYGGIFERNLGERSPLRLERGLNADPPHGGVLLGPFLD
jgi:general L-amino acid transport system substrate-binding protein